jgi:hypothetical protein
MLDTIHGWIAYVLMDNSIQSFLFAGTLAVIALLLWRGQHKDDGFDIRDIICSYSDGKQTISTSKTLLAGAFLTSSYYVVKNPSDTAYAAYLAAWVLNGGITAWQRTKTAELQSKKEDA